MNEFKWEWWTAIIGVALFILFNIAAIVLPGTAVPDVTASDKLVTDFFP